MRIPFFSHHRRSYRETPTSREAGFSLVELLVVIAIIGVISTVVLARYRDFNSTILLRDLAYEVALSVREAQVSGISVQGRSGCVAAQFGQFGCAYGVHFATSPGTTYTLFADLNDNGHYDSGASPSEDVSVYTIGQGNRISQLCEMRGAHPGGPACGTALLDVLFKRPEPDALFYPVVPVSSLAFRIVVSAPDGSTRRVCVYRTGQIAVKDETADCN